MLQINQDSKTQKMDLKKYQQEERSVATGLLMKPIVHKERIKRLCNIVFHAVELRP